MPMTRQIIPVEWRSDQRGSTCLSVRCLSENERLARDWTELCSCAGSTSRLAGKTATLSTGTSVKMGRRRCCCTGDLAGDSTVEAVRAHRDQAKGEKSYCQQVSVLGRASKADGITGDAHVREVDLPERLV
jgi:hypothetical protein